MRFFSNIFKSLIVIAGLLLFAHVQASAQTKRLLSTINKEQISIGDDVMLTLAIEAGTSETVFLPLLSDTIGRGLEITQFPLRDTLKVDGFLRHVLTVHFTAFDSGFYQIPAFKAAIVSANKDTAWFYSVPMLLRADYPNMTAEELAVIDTAQQERIFDIKENVDTPFTIDELWAYLMLYMKKYGIWLLLALTIAVAIWYWYKKIYNKKPVEVIKPKEIVPAHVRALSMLQALRAKQLWQNNQTKPFHSELTEILRGYIEERYQVPALEQTSDEILTSLHISGLLTTETQDMLKRILQVADFVKFAKFEPLAADNEQAESLAEKFIQAIIPQAASVVTETTKNV